MKKSKIAEVTTEKQLEIDNYYLKVKNKDLASTLTEAIAKNAALQRTVDELQEELFKSKAKTSKLQRTVCHTVINSHSCLPLIVKLSEHLSGILSSILSSRSTNIRKESVEKPVEKEPSSNVLPLVNKTADTNANSQVKRNGELVKHVEEDEKGLFHKKTTSRPLKRKRTVRQDRTFVLRIKKLPNEVVLEKMSSKLSSRNITKRTSKENSNVQINMSNQNKTEKKLKENSNVQIKISNKNITKKNFQENSNLPITQPTTTLRRTNRTIKKKKF